MNALLKTLTASRYKPDSVLQNLRSHEVKRGCSLAVDGYAHLTTYEMIRVLSRPTLLGCRQPGYEVIVMTC